MNVRAAFVALVLALLYSAPARAQQPASGAETTTLSTTTELVLVPAQVKGHDGKPLLGLKEQDFVLRSDGKPQPIRVFEPMQAANNPSTPVAQPLSPNHVSNVPAGGMPDQILILAIDLVNTSFHDQTRAKQQLLKYLLEQLPNQHFALVAITKDGLVQIHNFSTDPAVLIEALKRMQGSLDKEVVDEPMLLKLTLAESFGAATNPLAEYQTIVAAFNETQIYGAYAQRLAAKATLTALMQISQAYAGVPGRKSVIWLTDGLPTLLADPFAGGIKNGSVMNGDPELLDDYQQAFAALNNANIAIYGVDLKGLKLDRTYQATGFDQATNTRATAALIYGPGQMIKPGDYQDDAIKVVSAQTGGKSCTANAGLKDCIEQAVADSSSYYLLGFYVPQQERKAGWHKLDVKLVGEKGSVRSRNSYYLAPTTSPSDKEIGRSLRDAAFARIGYTGIAFSVERAHGQPGDNTNTPMMRIGVPASSVLLTASHPQLSYDIVTVPLTDKGEPAANLRLIHLNLNEQQTQSSLAKGWAYFDPPQGSGTQAVKYILRDNGTGRIGSLVVLPEKPQVAANN